jgi:hypothetical protein
MMEIRVHSLCCGADKVIPVEDVTGRGRLFSLVNNQMRHSIFVPIE